MKQTPEMNEVQRTMQAGILTRDGFLGDDTRHLIDILIEDDAEVKRLNLTHKMIADKMEYYRLVGLEGLGEFLLVDGHMEVKVETIRGKLPCPFNHRGFYQKSNITVRNKKVGKEITYSDLSIHLIAEHGFYQGKGSCYRLEPSILLEVMEIPTL